MTKKRRRSRSASPNRYGRSKGPQQSAPSSPSLRQDEPDDDGAEVAGLSSRQLSKKVDFAEEYRYVYQDLRRIAILAGTILVVLVVLSFVVS